MKSIVEKFPLDQGFFEFMTDIDDLDRRILDLLQADNRRPYAELAKAAGTSVSTVHDRLKRLQQKGVIKSQSAILDPQAVGLDVCAFIQITLGHPSQAKPFLKKIAPLTEVQECHHVTGEFDYLLKVRTLSTAALEILITEKIKSIDGVVRSQTLVALSSPKETSSIDCGLPRANKARK